MPSFSIPLSGLNASSEELSVISNNLANMNTIGFKTSDATFGDLFYQQIGSTAGGNPQQVGVGTSVASVEGNFTQGTIQTTGVPTNAAIEGSGLFVINKNGTQEYTRAGNFSVASNGNLVTVDGGQVMGYLATNGVVNTNQALSPLSIPIGMTSPAKVTSQIQLRVNLDAGAKTPISAASQQTGTGIAAGTVLRTGSVLAFSDGTNNFTYTTALNDTLTNVVAAINANANFTASLSGNFFVVNAKSGTPVTITTNSLTDAATSAQAETFAASAIAVPAGGFSAPITVYDSLGAAHVLSANFTKTTANNWNYSITIPAADVGQTGNPVAVKSGTLTFDSSGKLISPISNASFTISGLANGAANLTAGWTLFDSNGGGMITQLASPSATSSTQQDGYASGSLETYSVTGNGTIQGIFNNGQTLALGQIALALFTNQQGLVRTGSNNFVAGLSSGQPSVGPPTTDGFGTLKSGSLEVSNVDIATEFSKLIVAERYYQANAQTVTTFNHVLQTTVNMVQGV
jgi:flagellar hook protein FlgE